MVHGWAIERAREINARIGAAFNVTAFNIGLSLATMVAGRQVASDGLDGLPVTALMIVILAAPICFAPRRLRGERSAWQRTYRNLPHHSKTLHTTVGVITMFNWNFSETIPTNATLEQIWAQ